MVVVLRAALALAASVVHARRTDSASQEAALLERGAQGFPTTAWKAAALGALGGGRHAVSLVGSSPGEVQNAADLPAPVDERTEQPASEDSFLLVQLPPDGGVAAVSYLADTTAVVENMAFVEEASEEVEEEGDDDDDHFDYEAEEIALAHLPDEFRWNLKRLRKVRESDDQVVFKGRLRNDGSRRVEVRQTRVRDFQQMLGFEHAVRALKQFRDNPGFVSLFVAGNTEEYTIGETKDVYMVLEDTVGTLEDVVLKRDFDEVPMRVRLRLFIDMMRAARDMHARNIVHRDLRPESVLISGNCRREGRCRASLCNFENSCSYPGLPWPSAKLRGIEAPEAFTSKGDRPPQDVWALGLILYQMLLEPGKIPNGHFEDVMPKGNFNIQDDAWFRHAEEQNPELAQLVKDMMNPDPDARPIAADVLLRVEDLARGSFGFNVKEPTVPEPLDAWSDRRISRLRLLFRKFVPRGLRKRLSAHAA